MLYNKSVKILYGIASPFGKFLYLPICGDWGASEEFSYMYGPSLSFSVLTTQTLFLSDISEVSEIKKQLMGLT